MIFDTLHLVLIMYIYIVYELGLHHGSIALNELAN